MLNNAQLLTLKNAISSETDSWVVSALAAGNLGGVADFYNEDHASTIVWKTYLSEHEIVSGTSVDSTTWDWTAYIGTSTAEKMAWERIFNGTFSIDPSIDQVRAGIAAVFSGPSGAGQRTHLLAMAKRLATKAEALYITGNGTSVSPGKLTFEGHISYDDVRRALALVEE